MAVAYAAADLCLCRAGAGTVAELCALGKPSILVPFPFATNDHQRWNAEALVACGGARMVQDHKMDGIAVARIVREFLHDRGGLRVMADRAKSLAKPDAAARLADLVAQLARLRRPLAGTGNSERVTLTRVPSSKCQVPSLNPETRKPELGAATRSLEPGTWNCDDV
jgi:hypothetical protein